MSERFDLDEAVNRSRTPIDAHWSTRKRAIVAGSCALVALLAVGGGAWVTLAQRPPAMPTTAEEALQIMRTGAYDRLDEERRGQYTAEARRLLGNLSAEERRALLEGEENRQALWDLRQQLMEERARRIARGEEVEWPQQGERPSEEERQRWREQWENMTDEERAARRNELMDQARDRVVEETQTGNGQSSALIQEMRRSGAGRRGGGRR